MTDLPKVSIILPCYNMEKYIDRCIQSLLANDYTNKEIILVNDGSTDSTYAIIEKYANEYDCICAIHQDNAGVSAARNRGIDAATGEYIMFVDPDDYVETDFISCPVKKAIETDADLVLFGYKTSWYSQPPILRNYYPKEDYNFNSQTEIFNKVFPRFYGMTMNRFNLWLSNNPRWGNEKELPTIWRFLYKSTLIKKNSLKFRNLKLGEDATFVCDAILKAKSFATSKNVSYVYIPLQQGAFATTTSSKKILESKLKILEQRKRIATEIHKNNKICINNLYAGSNIISALQIGVAMAENGTLKEWKIYLSDSTVKQSISSISMTYRGGVKRWFPTLLLKYRNFNLLFILFKLAIKFNIKPNVW